MARVTPIKREDVPELEDIFSRAEQALGDKFDLREFHVVVLEGGSLPLTVLDAKIDRWIAGSK